MSSRNRRNACASRTILNPFLTDTSHTFTAAACGTVVISSTCTAKRSLQIIQIELIRLQKNDRQHEPQQNAKGQACDGRAGHHSPGSRYKFKIMIGVNVSQHEEAKAESSCIPLSVLLNNIVFVEQWLIIVDMKTLARYVLRRAS